MSAKKVSTTSLSQQEQIKVIEIELKAISLITIPWPNNHEEI